MEDRQNNAPSHEKARSLAKRLEFGPAPFIVGLVVALVFGWWIFPELLFSRQDQPVQFSHETHLKDASLDCSVCHHLRADGTFDALPSTKDCAVCHSQMLGKSEAERVFFNEYVKKGPVKPLPASKLVPHRKPTDKNKNRTRYAHSSD